jgi:farnesyl-diphosphate farnesyltransferase
MEALGRAELATLLERTSRTFALAIPLLGEPLATQVGASYLVFRLADTLEDAEKWGRQERLEALHAFPAWLDGGPWPAGTPTDDAGCIELMARADAVRACVNSFSPEARDAIVSHAKRTAEGMAAFVDRQGDDGELVLDDEEDLARYCYAVAGIVGEMLTELFLLDAPSLAPVAADLRARAAAFGEGLQLVNILKDAPADATQGRSYLPRDVARDTVVGRARADLELALEYVALLEKGKAPETTQAFCDLPVRLAIATLDRLDAGATKLTRAEVADIMASISRRP